MNGNTQVWTYRDGFVASHRVRTADGKLQETLIDRDTWGRIIRIETPEETVTYEYDVAGQLVTMTSATADTLVETSFDYTGAGQRARSFSSDGTEMFFNWDSRGWPERIEKVDSEGQRTDIDTYVNALGILDRVGTQHLEWDQNQGVFTVSSVGDSPVVAIPGVILLGAQDDYSLGGNWRPGRSTNPDDPYALSIAMPQLDALLPEGVSINASGSVNILGMEWMGARIYDPSTQEFLTRDPLEALLGSLWEANPYNYAGNNPLSLLDPLGLQPMTDAQLMAFADSHPARRSVVNHIEKFADDYAYLIAGAAIIGGVALMFIGVGGPAGIGAIGAGLSTFGFSAGIQKVTTGKVNWARAGRDGLIGVAAGTLGGAAGGWARNAIEGLDSTNVVGKELLGGAADSLTSSVSDYVMHGLLGDPFTAKGFVAALGGPLLGGVSTGGLSRMVAGAFGKLETPIQKLAIGLPADVLDSVIQSNFGDDPETTSVGVWGNAVKDVTPTLVEIAGNALKH